MDSFEKSHCSSIFNSCMTLKMAFSVVFFYFIIPFVAYYSISRGGGMNGNNNQKNCTSHSYVIPHNLMSVGVAARVRAEIRIEKETFVNTIVVCDWMTRNEPHISTFIKT